MTQLLGRRDDASRGEPCTGAACGSAGGTTPGGRSTLAWQRAVTSALRPLELTHVQFVLLGTVWWLVEPARGAEQLWSQRQIATHAGADVVMTSHVVRTLEHRGLLARIADPADARVRRLLMTAAGRVLAQRAVQVVGGCGRRLLRRGRRPAAAARRPPSARAARPRKHDDLTCGTGARTWVINARLRSACR